MERKTMITGLVLTSVSILLGTGLGYAGFFLTHKKADPPAVEQIQTKTKDTAGCKDNITIDDPSPYAKVATKYIKTIKSGSSTDIYSDRLDKVKDILTSAMYEKLVPNITKEEIASLREEAKKLDKSSITAVKVIDTMTSYKMISNNEYEIYVIYTVRTSLNDLSDKQRYLCRLIVKDINNKLQISNILEDSMLSNNNYQ